MQGDRPPIVPPKGPHTPLPKDLAATPFGLPVAVGEPARLAGVRVLVVEDDADSRELICAILEAAGAKVLCTESVAQAMDGVYHSFDPDIVLTDFSMPNADGLDLIREFRKAPSTRAVAVPVLVLSAHSEEHWRTRALEAGAAALLIKPFHPATLVAQIAAAVASSRSAH